MSMADVQRGQLPERAASQRDQAYERLRKLLILHQAPEGKRLHEERWAERLEVNRTALREAFARLEAEGLIERGPLPGYFVPTLTTDDIREIIEVRIMLEGGAIERICRLKLNTPARLVGMTQACDKLEQLVQDGKYAEVAEADRRYHEELVLAADNRRLANLYQRAPLPIIPPEIVGGTEWQARVNRTLQEHRAMLAAILKGDVPEALEVLEVHLSKRFFIPMRAM